MFSNAGPMDCIHNTSFYLKLMNWTYELLCYNTLGWKGLSVTNTLAYWTPFVSYEENEVL
jgi:hypothetical protein